MDFSLDTDQQLIRDALRQLLQTEFTYARRSKIVASDPGWDADLWHNLASHGYLGMFCGDDSASGPAEAMIVMQALGESICVEPYLMTSIVLPRLIRDGCSAELASMLGTEISAGRLRVAAGTASLGAATASPDTLPRVGSIDGSLGGDVRLCIGAAGATHFLVPYNRDGREAPECALIPLSADGVSWRGYPMHDGTRAADLCLTGVSLDQPGIIRLRPSLPGWSAAHDLAMLGTCAEAIGCMDRLVWQTVEYTKSRKQFGTTLSSFQVLQHVMVDMWMQLEQASAAVQAAAGLLSQGDAAAKHVLLAAKAFTGRAGRFVGQKSVQLHGGMGLTKALPIGQYFKRLTVLERVFGRADECDYGYAARLLE